MSSSTFFSSSFSSYASSSPSSSSSLPLGFLLLGIFYPTIAYHLGLEEGTSGHRFYSILVGLALLFLLFVYKVAQHSLAG